MNWRAGYKSLNFIRQQPVLPLGAGEWDKDANHLLLDPVGHGRHTFLALPIPSTESDDNA